MKYHLIGQLEVGESLAFPFVGDPCDLQLRVGSAARRYSEKGKKEFVTRVMGDVVRVWRIRASEADPLIETGIPVPPAKRGIDKLRPGSKYGFDTLGVGEKRFVPLNGSKYKQRSLLSANAAVWARKSDKKFSVVSVEGGFNIVRLS